MPKGENEGAWCDVPAERGSWVGGGGGAQTGVKRGEGSQERLWALDRRADAQLRATSSVSIQTAGSQQRAQVREWLHTVPKNKWVLPQPPLRCVADAAGTEANHCPNAGQQESATRSRSATARLWRSEVSEGGSARAVFAGR